MNRTYRTPLLLLLAVLGLGLAGQLVGYRSPSGEPSRSVQRLFPNLGGMDLQLVSLEPRSSIGLKRELELREGLWILGEGERRTLLKGEPTAKLLDAIARLDALTLTGPGMDDSEFGLDKPRYLLSIRTRDGRKYWLQVGHSTHDKSGYYVRAAELSLGLIDDTLSALLDSRLDELRETSLIPYKVQDLEAIVVEVGGGRLAASRAGGGMAWSLSTDGGTVLPGEEGKIAATLERWRGFPCVRGEAGREVGNKAAFRPRSSVSLYRRGCGQPLRLEIAQSVQSGVMVRRWDEYLRIGCDERAFRIRAEDWEDRRLSPFEPARVKRVIFGFDKVELLANLGPDGHWYFLKSPSQGVRGAPTPLGGSVNRDRAMVGILSRASALEWSIPRGSPRAWKSVLEFRAFDARDEQIAHLEVAGLEGFQRLVRNQSGRQYLLSQDSLSGWMDSVKKLGER